MTDFELENRVKRLSAGIAQSGECDTHLVTAFPADKDGVFVVSVIDKREPQHQWKAVARTTNAQTAILTVETFVSNYKIGFMRPTNDPN